MPFVDSREMLVRARAGRYAVGAFNVENMEMAQAVVMAGPGDDSNHARHAQIC